MSGEITVTPGKVFPTSAPFDDLTPTTLNALALPTMSVAAASVGKRELDLANLAAAITPSRKPQLFRNGGMPGDTFRALSGVSCPTATRTDNAAGWICIPSGAAVTYRQGEMLDSVGGTPEVTNIITCAEIVGATSVTTVDFGQFVPPDLTRILLAAGDFKVSCAVEYDNNGAPPPASGDIQFVVKTAVISGNGTSVIERDTSTAATLYSTYNYQIEASFAAADLEGLERGAFIGVRFASGTLDAATKSWRVTAFRLEPGTPAAAAAWIPPTSLDVHGPQTRNNWQATTDPNWTNDSTEGYGYGSKWRNASNNTVWTCFNATPDEAVWRQLSNRNTLYTLFLYQQATTVDGGGIGTTPALSDRIPWNVAVIENSKAAQLNGTDVELKATGSYRIRAVQTVFRTGAGQLSLYDTTARGNVARTIAAGDFYTALMRFDQRIRFTGTPPQDVELIPDALVARATDGLGLAADSGGPEVYGILEVEWLPEYVNLTGVHPGNLPIWDENVDLANETLESNPPVSAAMFANIVLLIGQDDATENGVYSWNYSLAPQTLLQRTGGVFTASYYTRRLFQQRGRDGSATSPADYRNVIQLNTITTLDTDPMIFVEANGYNISTILS